ncbi:hypothetical protein SAMN05444422_101326 [Halobiforma haloterrestris]|uniref:Uncharacterized protein n=1 Tax=Natronobacterium haloterrestre TaxID=148448 RepID=A0A1I1D5Z2_NATHA|nr:hypothetical protein [Halobiforma haloterrestris]SFB70335.1 hypothetical protein SAMN05444422_101326 [Halobiforma haloterrestris]
MTDRRARVTATVDACRFALARRDARAVVAVVGVGYLLAYLWVTDLLAIRPDAGTGWLLVDDPFARALERRGPISFEPVALLEFGYGTVLVSPIDVAIGAALAGLVGLNLALASLAVVRPAACGIDGSAGGAKKGAGAGLAAAVPALLSGSVCCAPAIALALGIQVSGALLATLPWLLPIGTALLVGSLGYLAGKIDVAPAATRESAARATGLEENR